MSENNDKENKKDNKEEDEEEEEEEEDDEEEKELSNDKEFLKNKENSANRNTSKKQTKINSDVKDVNKEENDNPTKKEEENNNNKNLINLNIKTESNSNSLVKSSPKKENPNFRTINSSNIISNKAVKNYIRCMICGKSKIKNPVTFTCNHIACFNCLIKDLILSQFKNCENKKHILFRCPCNVGNISIPFEEFQKTLKAVNSPIAPKKCREHKITGTKYCKNCELWLCNKCLEIHKVFNEIHELEETELPLKEICDVHSEYTLYYCMDCRKEICAFCISKEGKHKEHKYIPFSQFKRYTKEIKDKLKFKTMEECEKKLEEIRNKKRKEKKEKMNIFLDKIEELLNNIKVTKDIYVKEVEEKIEAFNKVIDLMKESYKYYYNLLNNEKQDFYTLDYLNKTEEIIDIKTVYSNCDELIEATKLVDKFSSKTSFLYKINTNEMPSPYTINAFSFNKFKKSAISKYSLANTKQIKYEKKVNILINTVYNIIKINNKNGIAVAAGNDILIIADINNYNPNNPETMSGHSKNITSLILLNENQLASGSEDKTIKIWDIQKRLCTCTITGNYERIESLLKINNNTIAAGSHNTIRVFNIENKKELFSLVGHEKSICTMIKISENRIVSGAYDNIIKIWDLDKKSCEYSLYGHDTTVFVVLLLMDGRLASGSGSSDKALKIWDLENKRCDCTLVGHKREIKCMQQMSNGWLLTGSVDKTIKVWNVKRKCCIQTLVSHFDAIYSLCILDKERFVSGSKDQDIIIWKY